LSIRYYEINLNEIVSKARRILEKHVKIAVLYGSATRRKLVRDIDIAVYMEPEPTLKQLLILEAKLEREIKIPVELRLITHLHPETAYKALTKGVKIVVKDPLLLNALTTMMLGQIQDMKIKYKTITRQTKTYAK